jgi:short-subunit dehydrogenase
MEKEVALITGGTSGIGAAFAQHFAKQGYDLIITGLPNDKISLNVDELKEKYNVKVEIILVEFANENDLARIENIIKGNDEIGVLINSAGFGLGKLFCEEDIRNLESMIKVHIIAPVRFIYAALPHMIRKKKGIIINLSSLSSFMPIPHDSMYSATKLFQNSLMESLHICYKDTGIKIQVLCPGFVLTNFHPRMGLNHSELKNMGILRWMRADKVVQISIRNLHKKNKVIVIPGFWNKVAKLIFTLTPTRFYYSVAAKFLQ